MKTPPGRCAGPLCSTDGYMTREHGRRYGEFGELCVIWRLLSGGTPHGIRDDLLEAARAPEDLPLPRRAAAPAQHLGCLVANQLQVPRLHQRRGDVLDERADDL